jgi:hypothetical protein
MFPAQKKTLSRSRAGGHQHHGHYIIICLPVLGDSLDLVTGPLYNIYGSGAFAALGAVKGTDFVPAAAKFLLDPGLGRTTKGK